MKWAFPLFLRMITQVAAGYLADEGKNHRQIALNLKISRDTARHWRRRWLGLAGKYNSPHHQLISLVHSSIVVANPSRIDSRMAGILSRYRVSCMDRQSASEISTALPRLLVMTIGSCDDAASSISR
jgi:hypothetical protein